MSELIFIVDEAPDGGYTARAVGHSIFTEAETWPDLESQIRDAVRCHLDDGQGPELVRLLRSASRREDR